MINLQLGCAAGPYLDVEGSALNLRCTLLDDEWDAVRAVLSRLGKVNTKQLQSALELFMTALDCKCFQALLVAGQRALAKKTEETLKKKEKKSAKVYTRIFLLKFAFSVSFYPGSVPSHRLPGLHMNQNNVQICAAAD